MLHISNTYFKYMYGLVVASHCLYCLQPLVLDQEFHVLGQQKLTDLKDKIVCVSDHVAVGEFSENPNQDIDILTKVIQYHIF